MMYTLYKRRWAIMTAVVVLNMAGYMLTIGLYFDEKLAKKLGFLSLKS